MPAGLQVWADAGFIQIDEDFFVMSKVASGRVTPVNAHPLASGYGTLRYIDISYTGTRPIIALNTGTQGTLAAIFGVSKSGNTYTWRVTLGGAGVNAGTAWVDYHIFDKPLAIGGSGLGLEVYQADGTLAYSSSAKLMKIGVPSGSGTWAFFGAGYVDMQEQTVTDELGNVTTDWQHTFHGQTTIPGGFTEGTATINAGTAGGPNGSPLPDDPGLGQGRMDYTTGLGVDITGL